jgi:signal peptidase I
MNDDQSMPDRAAGTRGPTPDLSAPPGAPAAGPGGPGSSGPEPAGPDGDAPGQPEAKETASKHGHAFWRELVVLIVLAMVIALVIKTFVVQAFFIPSSSMEDTLLIGDKVLVNKMVYHLRSIQPGDIIVFDGAGSWVSATPPARASSDPLVRAYDDTLLKLFRSIGGLFGTAPGQTDFIKRVIGVPGDHVACCNAQGLVTVNGVALHEKSYLYPGAAPSEIRFSITVPPGRLWVMGDNRLVSDDSRLRRNDPGSGTIPENMVIGRAFMIVWPPARWRILPIPATFGQPGIAKSAAAAGAAVARAGAAGPYVPLAGGFAVALPMTWLERRVRLRLRRRRFLRRR